MRLTTLFIMPISLVLAAPPPFGPYNITSWISDCIPGECYYSFNIDFAPDNSYSSTYTSPTEPSFTATCSGTDQQGAPKACSDLKVSANITNIYGGRGDLIVKHYWTVSSAPSTKPTQHLLTATKSVELYLGGQPEIFQIFATEENVD